MKKMVLIAAILVLNFGTSDLFSSINAMAKRDTNICLELTGQIINAFEGPYKMCKIELIDAYGVLDSLFLEDGINRFRFRLKKNSSYAIRVSKPGFVSRLISINTKLLSPSDQEWKFSFDTELIREEDAVFLNQDALDFPIAIIHYDQAAQGFIHNKQYTIDIKRELYQCSALRHTLIHRK